MSETIGSIFWLAVTLGVLVSFHEFGHFWVARRFGVKVLRFSIGFGSPIWSRMGRDGTEYAIGSIPLGGYVKFLDSREAEHPELVAGSPGEFYAKPPWQRILISFAGPAFNIVFTLFAFWAMFVIGRPDYEPVIAAPQNLAAQAGLHEGDRLVAVDGEKVDSYSSALLEITKGAAIHRDVQVEVTDAAGTHRTVTLALSQLPPGAPDNDAVFDQIGIEPFAPATVTALSKDDPAVKAGMLPGDQIVSVNGIATKSYAGAKLAIVAEAPKNPDLSVVVRRGDADLTLKIGAVQRVVEAKSRWIVGISGWKAPVRAAIEHYGPLAAVPAAFHETWKQTSDTLFIIKNMLVGAASVKNLSSVISIAQVANASAHQGVAWFLGFLAMISLSLGILNLLPIPILDGGHIVMTLVEWAKGSPVSERTLIAGQYVGLALLVTLMSLAFYNDIMRHVG